VKQKYTVWALAGVAFLVTLGITSWQNGLWSSGEPNAQPGGAAASHSIEMPSPIPEHPFQTTVIPPGAPPPAQITQPRQDDITQSPAETIQAPQPQPTAGPLTAPDPVNEQSQDDYKQRAKLMEEIAARARAQAQAEAQSAGR